MPLSVRTRSSIWASVRYWRPARGIESAALSSCFCSSRWTRARSSSFLSMTLMPLAISNASTTTFTSTPASRRRARSDSVTGRMVMSPLNPLHQHDRAPLVVVERAFLAWQLAHAHFLEAALHEPVLGARGEHEQALQLRAARARFDLGQQPLAGARVAEIGMHDEAGELTRALAGERVERGAADCQLIVLEHHEAPDFPLEPVAPALDADAFGLERLGQ